MTQLLGLWRNYDAINLIHTTPIFTIFFQF